MTVLAFDHVVHFLEKPEGIIPKLEQQGIHAVEGGRHEGRGTYNALSYFDLSYIEYLGTYDQKLVEEGEQLHHSMMETIIDRNFEESIVRFAARTTNIEQVAADFRAKGLTVTGPTPLFRKRLDGSIISWKLLYAGEENDSLKLPFIIQWDDDDEKRRQEQIAQGVIGKQLPTVAFEGVTFVVRNAQQTAEKWSNYLNITIKKEYLDEQLNAKVIVLDLRGGELQFAEPVGAGIVKETLESKGEVPLQINLTGFAEEKTIEIQKARYNLKK